MPQLPPELGERRTTEPATFEDLAQAEDRRRRARLTFWLLTTLGILAALPLLALYLGLCVMLFRAVAG